MHKPKPKTRFKIGKPQRVERVILLRWLIVTCVVVNPFAIPIYLFSIAKKQCCFEFFSKDERRMFQRFHKSSSCFSSIRILFKNRKQHAFAAQTHMTDSMGENMNSFEDPPAHALLSRESQHWIFAGLRIHIQTR